MTQVDLELSPPLRVLFDNRLDAINRTLLVNGTSRQDRVAVIEDVEAQMREMLGQRVQGVAPTRQDVLEVLAALDPPEAFFGVEEQSTLVRHRPVSRSSAFPHREPSVRPATPQPSIPAICSAMGGLILLVLSLWLVAAATELGMAGILLAVFWFIAAIGVNAAGVYALIRIRQSDGWLYGLPLALFGVMLLPLVVINGSLIVTVMMYAELGLYGVVAVSWFLFNAIIVWQSWKWVSVGYTNRASQALREPGRG